MNRIILLLLLGVASGSELKLLAQPSAQPTKYVLRAARLLNVVTGVVVSPAEIVISGEHITGVGQSVAHPAGAQVIDLGDQTLLPGLIDVHVHLFLHPGSEDGQTIEESVPQRTIEAVLAARADLQGGFTAERDMGTEGAGSADTALRNAIDKGLIEGPRLRISGNAISILGGHEDALHYNPELHILSNATYANSAAELVAAMRQQWKEGSDFTKIYETGRDTFENGIYKSPYQYTANDLTAAVAEAARLGRKVAVHATAEPGTGYAAEAGVSSIDHADQLSEHTMQVMREKGIYAVPTFTIYEYFASLMTGEAAQDAQKRLQYKFDQFKVQLQAGIPIAAGSDVGPFAHGTQAKEYELLVQHGMTPAAALQAGLLNGAKLLGWEDRIGQIKAGFLADVIAVPGDPLTNIKSLQHVSFVMKGGSVYRLHGEPTSKR